MFYNALASQTSLIKLLVGQNLFTNLVLSFDNQLLSSLQEFNCTGSPVKTALTACNLTLDPTGTAMTSMRRIIIKDNPNLATWNTVLAGSGFVNGVNGFRLLDLSGCGFPADQFYAVGVACDNLNTADGINNATLDLSGGTTVALAKVMDGVFPSPPFTGTLRDVLTNIVGTVNVFFDDGINMQHIELLTGTFAGAVTIDDGGGNSATINSIANPYWYTNLTAAPGWTINTN